MKHTYRLLVAAALTLGTGMNHAGFDLMGSVGAAGDLAKAAASSDSKLATIADSELGAMMEEVLNAQFSQSQETVSDDYGLQFMKKHKYDVHAMESMLRKLGSQGGGLTASHPAPADRADRIKEMAGK